MPIPNKFMVFDVESIGLHGEGFAVGYVVVDREANELERGLYVTSSHGAAGLVGDHKWVEENVPSMDATHTAPWMIRAAFWRRWLHWHAETAVLAADCAWPVEARFLADCVKDHPNERAWAGPYPLIDIGSVLFAKGFDPVGKYMRKEEELPEHNPLKDALQSARILLDVLDGLAP